MTSENLLKLSQKNIAVVQKGEPMNDLIRRQDVLDIIMGDGLYCDTYDDKEYSAEKIKSIPTADLSEYCDKLWKTAYERGKAEAHPKKGKWIKDRLSSTCGWSYGVCRCSVCDSTYQDIGYGWNFCPNCGADMREESE